MRRTHPLAARPRTRGSTAALRTLLDAATQPIRTDRTSALRNAERLSAVTHIMAGAEHLFNQHERRPGGVNHWAVTRTEHLYKSRTMKRVLDVVAHPRITDLLHVGKIIAAGLLLAPTRSNRTRAAANAFLAGSSYLMAPRHHYGGDGSDQASFLVQAVSALARANPDNPRWQDACLWALSLQAGLSYFASGWVKVAGTRWIRDEAVVGVMRTRTYGFEHFWRMLRDYPQLNTLIGRGTLALECGFVAIFLGRGRLTRPLLAATAGLHLGIAASMALGRFVPAFLGMYPALAYATQPRELTGGQPGGPRSDLLPAYTAAAAVAAAAALQVQTAGLDRAVRSLRPGSRTVSTRSGNTLAYQVRRHRDPDAPVVVFENGLMSMPELWSWIEDRVAPLATTVTYDRAGYGPSAGGRKEHGFAPMYQDLIDLLEEVGDGRPTVVVGHSLGGYLVHRAACERPDLVAAVMLVDSTHPHELSRSLQQKLGSEALVPQLRISAVTLALGFGPALDAPPWVSQLPETVRPRVLAQYRNRRLWQAGHREWLSALAEFDRVDRLRDIEAPLLVMSAGRSIENDPEVLTMHKEMVASSPRGEHHVVDGATHDGILVSRPHAEQAADHIVGFMRDLRLVSDDV
jgi:pimeloyl-ACP methyl ester carboxylesterase